MHPNAIDRTGQRFGMLTVVKRAAKTPGSSPNCRNIRWECLCDCGSVKTVQGHNLADGSVQSCGCKQLAHRRTVGVRHGGCQSVEYKALRGAIHRCHCVTSKQYPNYGGRGISVFPAWRTPEGVSDFLAHVGKRPGPDFSLDRIDNDGDYAPGNLRWADKLTQRSNQRTRTQIENFSDDELRAEYRRRNLDLPSMDEAGLGCFGHLST